MFCCCASDSTQLVEVVKREVLTPTDGSPPVVLEGNELVSKADLAKSSEGSSGFYVELEKTRENKLGLSVLRYRNQRLSHTLIVDTVKDGLVSTYNDSAPFEKRIRNGDIIVEVNGVSGNSSQMLEAVTSSMKLRFLIQHPQ